MVIGGGIGGLTSAVALQRKGWAVTLFERAPSLDPVGSGLSVGANALKALDTIGLGDALRGLSSVQGEVGIRRPGGEWLLRTTGEHAAQRYGDSIVLVLRATLVDLLAGRLDGGSLRLGTPVTAVDAGTGVVTTAAGEVEADLVVAADGIHSATRRALFPAHPGPVHTGVTSWRLVVPRQDVPVMTSETWGRGLVFGVVPLSGDLVYCYATAPAGQSAPSGEKDELLRLFGGWHAPIPRLLAAADPAQVLRHDVLSLDEPLPAFHRGRVVLLGDAAHAMTPNLGQGACQAIEDAVVLAHLAGAPGRQAAYTAARLPRTTTIVRRSRRIARATTLRNPLAVRLRDRAMAIGGRLDANLLLRHMDDVLGWTPPAA
ncbi:monooxygenase [Microtetraspora sp. NBRC 13810]|nr:monooxygenase [Microtetraspora sp. NBRC 13810]